LQTSPQRILKISLKNENKNNSNFSEHNPYIFKNLILLIKMVQEIFINLSIILVVTLIVSLLMKFLKQPLIIGYILSGILVGPYIFNLITSESLFQIFSQIGVALLLFIVGLHMNPKVIKEVGFASLVTGIGQVLFTSVFGFFIAKLLGFSTIISIYVAVALTFSSTIIIMKLLADKRDLETLYGKIAIGFLIVQDFIAIIALMAISSLSGNLDIAGFGINIILKGFVAIILVLLFSHFILSRASNFFAKSQELLFLFSIGWCLAIASLFFFLNFSLEIGALLAGISLSITPYSNEISSKMKPLRDFFIVLFFVLLGSQMIISDVTNQIVQIIVFSIFILIGNPLIVMILMGLLGYTKRTGFLAGLTVAQISEFSLILIALGISVGHLPKETLSIVTTVGLITIMGSTYLIIYSNQIYQKISKYLGIFERKKVREKINLKSKNYDAILFGQNRIGFGILNSLRRIKKNYLVVDFNPETISNLKKLGIPCMYGDADDVELLDELPLEKAKIIVSTIPDFETNLVLIENIRRRNKEVIIIVRAHQIKDAFVLYEKGADYVLTPHFLGGEYVSRMIFEEKTDKQAYKLEKEKHIKMLKEIARQGHEHPDVEKG